MSFAFLQKTITNVENDIVSGLILGFTVTSLFYRREPRVL